MYKKYFDEYYVTDKELRQLICEIIGNLTVFSPEEFNTDLLSRITPEQDSKTFLQNLIALIPIVAKQKKNFEFLPESQSLRISTISLDFYLYAKRLEYLLLKLIHMGFASQFLGIRYLIATEIIEKDLGEELKYNSELLSQNLMNPYKTNEQEEASVIEAILAEEEIERVCSDEGVNGFFWSVVGEFEESMENYIKKGLPNIVHEMFGRIFFEAVMSNTKLLENSLGLEILFTSEAKKQWKDILFKIARQGTNFRLGLKHGGLREREGFSWTKERRIEFYKMVEAIPKISRKKNGQKQIIYIWDYIFEQFDSRGIEAKALLMGESNYKSIPMDLLDEAFYKWQNYEESHTNIKSDDSPKMFLFRHALQILNFPSGHFNKRENKFIQYKKSTLQKYYNAGEKAIIKLDNQDET